MRGLLLSLICSTVILASALAQPQLQRGYSVDIPPMQRHSAFAWEWVHPSPSPAIGIPRPVPDDFYGSARIVSDVPIVVGALQVLLPEGKLVSAVVTPEP